MPKQFQIEVLKNKTTHMLPRDLIPPLFKSLLSFDLFSPFFNLDLFRPLSILINQI